MSPRQHTIKALELLWLEILDRRDKHFENESAVEIIRDALSNTILRLYKFEADEAKATLAHCETKRTTN